MSEYDEEDLAYQELLKEADAAAIEIVRLNEKTKQLEFEIDTLKDFVSNMFELKRDVLDVFSHWRQGFETAGITNAIDRGETKDE
jgi:hypothetical protein